MYGYLLIAHNVWRWVVILGGVAAVAVAMRGLKFGLPWAQGAEMWGTLFGRAVDVQVLMGAALYLLYSPLTNVVMSSVGDVPGSDIGFIGVYHAILMTLVLFDVHLSAHFIGKAHGDVGRHRRSIILYGQTLALILASIPWWRPLLRL